MLKNIKLSIFQKINSAKTVSAIFLLSLISLSLLYSCSANIFSVEDDVKMGGELNQQVKEDSKQFPILQGHQDVKDYVSGLGRYVLENSKDINYKNVFPYQFQIIDDDSTVNAFCISGGYIYVYTGLIKFLDNEAALTGVIGHEIAHAERRHMTQRLTSYYGVSVILGLVLGSNPNQLGEIAANLFVGLGFLANSRADEEEADNYSIKYLTGTQYYPGAISFFFDKIRAEQKKAGTTPSDLEGLLATHPLPEDRIKNVNTKLNKIKPKPVPTEGLFTDRYQQMKAKLQ
ncbi:MAG TPA: M48 family metalloprotease [Ignavibacteria bacterium]|nr:M48 family metalloprotease [Ignavibacteria bacterium]